MSVASINEVPMSIASIPLSWRVTTSRLVRMPLSLTMILPEGMTALSRNVVVRSMARVFEVPVIDPDDVSVDEKSLLKILFVMHLE